MSLERRRQMIEPEHPQLSIVRQCELVSISRSGFYRHPAGENPLNLTLMRLIDAQFLETPPPAPPGAVSGGDGAVGLMARLVRVPADGVPSSARGPYGWLAANGYGG